LTGEPIALVSILWLPRGHVCGGRGYGAGVASPAMPSGGSTGTAGRTAHRRLVRGATSWWAGHGLGVDDEFLIWR